VSQEFDTQLLESVAVRRRRLRGALLWGTLRTRRRTSENVTRFVAGIAVTAVLLAGCVGWAFLQQQLSKQREQEQQRRVGTSAVLDAPVLGS
jgi:uncharacterized protein HemX